MSSIQYLTIGYIPNDCKVDVISCGDPSGSGTNEVSLKIEGNEITSIDTLEKLIVDPIDFSNEKSKLWKQLAKTFCSGLSEKELKPIMVGGCWAIFTNESAGKKGITQLADENDGGEFHNRGGSRQGVFYIRYQLEEDGEYYGEQVLGFS